MRSAVNAEVLRIVIECGGGPSSGGVTGLAIMAEIQCGVVHRGRLREIRLMALIAVGIDKLVITAYMARPATRYCMLTRQDKPCCCMVERGRLPGVCRVTLRAILGELCRDVIRICHLVEIRAVTGIAGGGNIRILVVDMTVCAGNGKVGAGERKIRSGVIEGGWPPSCSCVTLLADCREPCVYMIRICGAGIGTLMARDAFHGETGIDVVYVAGNTNLPDVSSCQWKLSKIVVKACIPGSCGHIVALETIR